MARIHARHRGSSSSDKPVVDEAPEWNDVDTAGIEAHVAELAEQGKDPDQIDLSLRDEGVKGVPVPDVELATGKKVATIPEENDAANDPPEDLRNLMEYTIRPREHMEENQQDKPNHRVLQNTGLKIRRLVLYYRGDKLDDDFTHNYDVVAELLGK